MITIKSALVILSLILPPTLLGAGLAAGQDFLDLWGPYFGQPEPDTVPLVFADGIISGRPLHGTPVFSPDLTELYWAEFELDYSNANILVSRMIDNRWTEPQVTPFCSAYVDDDPVFSPNGQRLFFNSLRPVNGSICERIWFVDRQSDSSWSAPALVDDAVNGEELHWQIAVDRRGAIYFQSERPPSYGGGDLFRSDCLAGVYQTPANLGAEINSAAYECTPFHDPSDRFLLYTRSTIFLISDRLAGGTWATPRDITAAHPEIQGVCPQITPDRRYLFFTVMGEVCDVYWVSAEFINDDYTAVDGPRSECHPTLIHLNSSPNPFNPRAVIEYYLQEAGPIRLTVHDLTGRRIAVLDVGEQTDGAHRTEFDASGLASGTYVYRLTTRHQAVTGKMTLVR